MKRLLLLAVVGSLAFIDRAHGQSYELAGAVWLGNTEAVRTLLSAQADANAVDPHGWPLLLLAARRGHADIVSLLIEAGADIDGKNSFDETPIGIAAYWGRLDVVRMLLEKGAFINEADKGGRSPLLRATEVGHKRVVSALVRGGADMGQADKKGQVPLLKATKLGRENMVDLFLSAGAQLGDWVAACTPEEKRMIGRYRNSVGMRAAAIRQWLDDRAVQVESYYTFPRDLFGLVESFANEPVSEQAVQDSMRHLPRPRRGEKLRAFGRKVVQHLRLG